MTKEDQPILFHEICLPGIWRSRTYGQHRSGGHPVKDMTFTVPLAVPPLIPEV